MPQITPMETPTAETPGSNKVPHCTPCPLGGASERLNTVFPRLNAEGRRRQVTNFHPWGILEPSIAKAGKERTMYPTIAALPPVALLVNRVWATPTKATHATMKLR
jgi:hypothetical protein